MQHISNVLRFLLNTFIYQQVLNSHSELVHHSECGFFSFFILLSHRKNGEVLAPGKDKGYFYVILKVPPGTPRLPVGKVHVAGDDKMRLHS